VTKPSLNVVGEIKPPQHKDPVQMLRNLADNIEAGKYGDVETIAIAIAADQGYEMFGGGRNSTMEACAFLYGAAHLRLSRIPWSDV